MQRPMVAPVEGCGAGGELDGGQLTFNGVPQPQAASGTTWIITSRVYARDGGHLPRQGCT